MSNIKSNLDYTNQKILEAARKVNTSPEDITLVGVTKYADAQQITELVRLGITDIGENKVQSAIPKIESLSDLGIRWHFVGHLQSNKVKYLIDHISLYHSLDRISLAKEMNKRANLNKKQVEVLAQVNIADDQNKYGLSVEETEPFIQKILEKYQHINIKGLMTMLPYEPNPEDTRPYFARMKELFDLLKSRYGKENFQYLSMGMSHDFQIAIEEGANMVRIGRILFDPREEG